MKQWLTGVLLGAILGLAPAAAFAESVELPPRENFYLFLLVGQSNMAGRGKVAEEDRVPNPRVLMLNKAGEWVPAVDPLHFDKSAAGVGVGKSFGLEIAKAYPEATIGLIPCAVGGSSINAWVPGGYHDQTKSHPWDDMLKRARPALKQGVLKGILWHQGESDSNAKEAPLHAEKLQELIARFRKELDAPEVPFIAGQLGQFPESPWNEYKKQVDAVHRQLPDQVSHTAFVSSEGLTHKGDKVHFNAESYREFGRRYAAAWLKLVSAEN
ncbi:MAG: sialate O-acetylesterase [Planctomycetaceae bacterium]|nr:sialate O-acetylesterase [Planctomycetaceae bacterium]